MPKELQRLVVALFVVCSFLICQATQTLAGTTGSINGRVTDELGKPVAGVHVTIVSPSFQIKTASGSNGFYTATGLVPDTYTVTFAEEAYQTQVIRGITISQDQVYVLDVQLTKEVKTLARVPVRSSTALVQPSKTVNQYTVTSSGIQTITGTPQNISETDVLNALPGVTTDNGGYPIIRGGAENDEGFEYEGIDATEPVTGQFINSLTLNGVSRLQLSTGGYDVSEGNTNSGVVNVVAKRGTFPGAGQATIDVGWPNYNHRLSFDYGNSTPDNRFSYYYSFNGLRTNEIYGNGTSWYRRLNNALESDTGNDNVINLLYHWGNNGQNELQYFSEFGDALFNQGFQINPATTPYATNNCVVIVITGGPCSALPGTTPGPPPPPYGPSGLFINPNVSLIDFAPTFPTQAALNQNINYPDHEDENHVIEKLNWKHQFSASSFGEIRATRTITNVNFLFPWDGGALADQYEFDGSDNRGIAFDYSNQVSAEHDVSIGGETLFTVPNFTIAIPSSSLFTAPLECGEPCFLLGLTGTLNPNFPPELATGLPGYTYVAPVYNEVAPALGYDPTTATSAVLSQIPNNASNIYDDIHRNNVWIKDRWQPTTRWVVTAGLRWDQEILDLPSNVPQQSMFYTQNAAGTFIDVPGPPVGKDVTQPHYVSPRIAASYQADPGDVFRLTYGSFMEFTPLSNIENVYTIDAAAQGCTMSNPTPANPCFHTLPGFSATCVNGVDPAHGNAPCNHITNLYQQTIEDLNKNNFAQYTPVLPQTAVAGDIAWEHDFGHGLQLKINPWFRRGYNYVVASTPLLYTLPDGTSVFGSPRESNAGINQNTGIDFAVDLNHQYGWSGFIHATYDNTLANYNSDFFPSVNAAAVAANHLFHVDYVAPVTATGNVNFTTRSGWWINATMPYESGYYYGVGKMTFVFGPNGQPVEVPNTDLAAASLGQNVAASAYYFTDPTNPGTILHPNIVGSRGTNEGNDPGSLQSPYNFQVNLTVAHDIHMGPSTSMQAGIRVINLFGYFSNFNIGQNSRYVNNGIGAFAASSGARSSFSYPLEPYVYPASPYPYENEPIGTARTYTFYLSAKY